MIFGLEVNKKLPENFVPLEAVAVVKCLDENGKMSLVFSATKSLTSWEALGMLTAATTAQDWDLQRGFDDEEE